MILGLALAAVMFAGASAHAATTEELQAQINALLAQLSALQGGSSSSAGCYAFTQDLTIGSQGADVTALQNYLATGGYFKVAATGYFGPITQSAVAAWQAANGVTPSAGYFGALSRAKYNAVCTPASTGGSTSGSGSSFSGTDEGYLDEFDQLSKYSSEEVGEDEEDVPVLGEEFEAKDADQMIERVIVNIDTPTGGDDLEDFISDVSLWLDGEEIGRMDVEDAGYTRSTDLYSFRFTGLEGIVKEGDVAQLVVAVTGVKNLDSGDQGDGWTVEIPADGIRASSPNGVVDEYGSAIDETFTLETFASATGVELKAALSDDNPDAQIVNVDADNDTNDVELLRFTLEAKGSDITINDIPIYLTPTGATVTEILNSLTLTVDGDEYSETPAATTTFDNLDITIDEGDEVEFVVTGDVNDLQGSFGEGDSINAMLGSVQVDAIDAEDGSGEDLGAADLTGTALGEEMSFYDTGIMVTLVSTDRSVTVGDSAGDDVGTFEVVFDVEAFDGTVYVAAGADTTATTSTSISGAINGNLYRVEQGGTATTAGLSVDVSYTDKSGNPTGDAASENIALDDGEVARVNITVSRTNAGTNMSGLYRMVLGAIGWNTDDGQADGDYNAYTFNLDDFKTSTISLN